MKKLIAALALATTLVGATASVAYAKNGADDPGTRLDCRHGETVCVNQ